MQCTRCSLALRCKHYGLVVRWLLDSPLTLTRSTAVRVIIKERSHRCHVRRRAPQQYNAGVDVKLFTNLYLCHQTIDLIILFGERGTSL